MDIEGSKFKGFKVQNATPLPPVIAFLLMDNFFEHCYKISKLPTKSKILSIQNTK